MTNGNDTIGGLNTAGGWHEYDPAPDPRRDADTLSGNRTLAGDGRIVLAGRYVVVKRLGEGGMGSVWLAEDQKLDNRKVAIKMLPAVLAGKKAAYRQVKAEALMAMRLSHPNIATVRSFEEDEGGNPFLVMDCIEGQGLDDLLADRGTLSEEETVKILAPVAAALDYAHAQGVVHRDVKPGNVMVRKDGTPFVLDFGIAREVQETMTRVTGKLSSGTLLYMSPEQLNGDKPRAVQDVYSFAAMAYECLSGEPPFARGQIEWQIMNKAPEALPDGVGEALRNGVMAGLAKDPKDRPAGCSGVLGGQAGKMAGPIEIHPAGLGQPASAESRSPGKTGEEIFLLKVRLNNELESAGQEKTTGEEKTALGKVREMATAGEEALHAGDKAAARTLFGKAEAQLKNWRAALADRLETWKEQERETGKTVLLPGGAEMAMAWCPPGSFLMGSPKSEKERTRDELLHRVTLTEGFWLAKHPVTQRQWRSVMGNNPSSHKGDNLPVERVSWNDAQEFCKKCREAGLMLRLPTEAQWEYACRAGSEGPYGTGRVEDMAWYEANSDDGYLFWFRKPHPVGMKRPNAWGLHDMHGNVWEWCEDWYGNYPTDTVTDPTGPSTGTSRVIRGGGWGSDARSCRCAFRFATVPTYKNYDIGFRPCCPAGVP